jgi:hypothetical protein
MKLELKSENENYSKLFSTVFKTVSSLAVIFFLCDLSLKLGIISKHFQIQYSCNHLSVDKSKSNFEKLSKLSNLKNKQRILEFCREVIK